MPPASRLAIKMKREDKVVLSTIGEGSTSQGEWYEAVNWAAIHNLPVIFLIQNNMYAISVPTDKQMAVSSAAEKACGLGLDGRSVDGTDIFAVYEMVFNAAEKARRGEGRRWWKRWCTASRRIHPMMTTAPTARGKRWKSIRRKTHCWWLAICWSGPVS
jgi:hypothetical protein